MKTKCLVSWAAVACALAGLSLPPSSRAADATAAGQFSALQMEYTTASQEFSTKYREAKTNEERAKLAAVQPTRAFAQRFLDFALAHPKDSNAADALVRAAQGDYMGNTGAKAFELLAKDHLSSPKILGVLPHAGATRSPAGLALLKAVAEKSSEPKLQAQAILALANKVKDSDQAAAERYFNTLAEKFGAEKVGTKSMADHAKSEIEAMKKMADFAIGKVAPEIQGDDLHGKNFKLSDYRGKVVVIDFWGDW